MGRVRVRVRVRVIRLAHYSLRSTQYALPSLYMGPIWYLFAVIFGVERIVKPSRTHHA